MGMAKKQKEMDTPLDLLKNEMLFKNFDLAKSSHVVTFYDFI